MRLVERGPFAAMLVSTACAGCGLDKTGAQGGSNYDASAAPGAPAAPGTSAPATPEAGVVDAALPKGPPPWTPNFGANVDATGTRFRLWAPGAAAVHVVGDVPGGSMTLPSAGGGEFEGHADGVGAGARYHFELDTPSGTLTRLDPYCRERSDPDCLVVDPNAYGWKTPTFAAASRQASVVYEMHVGSFTTDPQVGYGTFASARPQLADLADLGVDVVELMPVQAFGGTDESWGYDPQLWLAPKPSYGAPDDLRAFIDEAHGQGIAVWLDVVMNHYDGYDQAPLFCFDGACPNGSAGVYFFPDDPYAWTPWGPRPDYTSLNVAGMLEDSVHQWLVEYRGDGFRWDSTNNIRALDGNGTTPGGRDLLVNANDLTHGLGGLSVAEDLKGDDQVTASTASGGFGFDAQWDGFGWQVTGVLVGYSDDARDLGVLRGLLFGGYGGDPFTRLIFTETHDTVGNGGSRLPDQIDPADPTSWAARKRSMLGAAFLMTTPGVPMIFMGQEQLATGTFLDPPDALAPPTARGLEVRAFYRDLIRLRRNLDGGAGGLQGTDVSVLHEDDSGKVLAFSRGPVGNDQAIVVLNLRNQAYARYDIGVPTPGTWRVRIDSDRTAYGDDFGGGGPATITTLAQPYDGQPCRLPLTLSPYGAMILTL
jgi:1,4-alpha-glucan branching enzyme